MAWPSNSQPSDGFIRRRGSARLAHRLAGVPAEKKEGLMPDQNEIGGQSTAPVVTVTDSRAVVRLNRPCEHNRLEPADLAVLRETFDRFDADPSIRVLVLTGTGKSFSSGFHIGALADRLAGKDVADEDRNAFEHMVDRLEALRVPTIAALNGSVYGGATDLALACDFRIGVEGMRLLMPSTRLGVAAAKKLFLTAQPIDAAEMLRIGYLDEIVSAADLMNRAEALAATLAANAPLAVVGLKRAINEAAVGTLDRDALGTVRAFCAASADHAEGVRAWAEKRARVRRPLRRRA